MDLMILSSLLAAVIFVPAVVVSFAFNFFLASGYFTAWRRQIENRLFYGVTPIYRNKAISGVSNIIMPFRSTYYCQSNNNIVNRCFLYQFLQSAEVGQEKQFIFFSFLSDTKLRCTSNQLSWTYLSGSGSGCILS